MFDINELKEKVKSFSSVALKKTGEVTEIASLRTKVLTKKKSINEAYYKLGKQYYEAHKEEACEFMDEIEAINKLYTDIEELEAEIKEKKEKLPESVAEGVEAEEVSVPETVEEAEVTEETAAAEETAEVGETVVAEETVAVEEAVEAEETVAAEEAVEAEETVAVEEAAVEETAVTEE